MGRPQKSHTEEDKKSITAAYNSSKDAKEQKRLLCLQLRIVKEFPVIHISEIVGFSVSFIGQIIGTFHKEGLAGIRAKKQQGNRRNFSFQQEADFLETFSKRAEKGEMLEVSDVILGYETLLGRPVSKSVVYKMLKRHNWRKVMPRSKHPNKASVEEIEAYKKNH